MFLSAHEPGAGALAPGQVPLGQWAPQAWPVAPRTRAEIAAAAHSGAAGVFCQPAARAALAAAGEWGAEAARLLSQHLPHAGAFEAHMWRWASAEPDACAGMLKDAALLDQALSGAFARFLDCMLAATPSEPYEALRTATRRLRAFPEDAFARAAVLALIGTFSYAMMTGPVALRAAIEDALRDMGDELLAAQAPSPDWPALQGFQESAAPAAFDHALPIGQGASELLDAAIVADWLVQRRDDAAPRFAVFAAMRHTAAADLQRQLDAAAARQALTEPPDAEDLRDAAADLVCVLGAGFLQRAAIRACCAPLDASDTSAFVAAFAALASHPLDGRALRATGVDAGDIAIRFDAIVARDSDARRRAAFRAIFSAFVKMGAAGALAELAFAHACLRPLIVDTTAHDRVAAGAMLLDLAGFTPRALRAGLALRRLCAADDGALAHAWRPTSPHASVIAEAFAPA